MINLPNLFTFSRLVLTPLFLIFVLYGRYLEAFFVFLFAGITDVVDGFMARRFGRETPLGAILDPVADKIFLNTAYIVLAFEGLIPKWLTVSFLFRDAIILVGFLTILFLGRSIKPRPTALGKANTAISVVTVLAAMSWKLWGIPGSRLLYAIFAVDLATIVLSGSQYTLMGIRFLNRGEM